MLESYVAGARSVRMLLGEFTFNEMFNLNTKDLKLLSSKAVFEQEIIYGTLRLGSLKVTWKFFSYNVKSFIIFSKIFLKLVLFIVGCSPYLDFFMTEVPVV